MSESETIAHHLKFHREKRRFTINRLATAIGVHYQTVYSWEQKLRRVPSDKIEPICRALGISPNDLIYDIPPEHGEAETEEAETEEAETQEA